MNIHLLALYVAAVFLAMIAPGPDMLFILATGTRGGPRAGLLATLGVVTSEVGERPGATREHLDGPNQLSAFGRLASV